MGEVGSSIPFRDNCGMAQLKMQKCKNKRFFYAVIILLFKTRSEF